MVETTKLALFRKTVVAEGVKHCCTAAHTCDRRAPVGSVV